jgi:hypothetical protein
LPWPRLCGREQAPRRWPRRRRFRLHLRHLHGGVERGAAREADRLGEDDRAAVDLRRLVGRTLGNRAETGHAGILRAGQRPLDVAHDRRGTRDLRVTRRKVVRHEDAHEEQQTEPDDHDQFVLARHD